jgi:superfamily I DNA/RNA helicase
VVDLWEVFDAECLSRGLIGFDHQIAWATRMLAEKPTARAFARRDYRHVVVDEFQDVNDAQIALLAQIAPPGKGTESGPDLCVVGDDDQAIYGFRGADDRAFQKFAGRWTNARTVMLEENYRSGSAVLEAAATVIGRAHTRFRPDKIVRRATNAGAEPAGSVVEGVRLETHYQAGEVIATTIRHDLETREGARLGDHAVIARNWTDLDRIRGALELEGIPCVVSKGPAPKDDPGVEDVLAWIDLLLNPTHAWSARRLLLRPPLLTTVPWVKSVDRAYHAMVSRHGKNARKETDTDSAVDQPGFMGWFKEGIASGAIACPDEDIRRTAERFVRTWEALRDATATAPAHAAIAEIVQKTAVVHAELLDGRGRAARVSAVVGLLRFARERAGRLEQPGDLRAFVSYLEDLDEDDASFRVSRLTHEEPEDEIASSGEGGTDKADAVSLLTAHRSKGLEFDTVHLPRVESQYGYPSLRTDDEENRIPGWLAEGEDGVGDWNGTGRRTRRRGSRTRSVGCSTSRAHGRSAGSSSSGRCPRTRRRGCTSSGSCGASRRCSKRVGSWNARRRTCWARTRGTGWITSRPKVQGRGRVTPVSAGRRGMRVGVGSDRPRARPGSTRRVRSPKRATRGTTARRSTSRCVGSGNRRRGSRSSNRRRGARPRRAGSRTPISSRCTAHLIGDRR